VYAHLDWLEEEAGRHGIPVVRVTNGNLREQTMNGFVGGTKSRDKRCASLPLYVLSPSGDAGMIRRQCTSEYKITPIEKYIKKNILGLKKTSRWPTSKVIDQWMGISTDELRRVRQSKVLWNEFVYPFCNLPDKYLERPMNRAACVAWLARNYPGRDIPRSACVGCPFHSNEEWRHVRDNPDEWASAIEVDEAIRHADGMRGTVYLHRSCKPLSEADLGDQPGQLEFGFSAECLGYCGS